MPVCDTDWGKAEADAFCKELGFKDGGVPTRGGWASIVDLEDDVKDEGVVDVEDDG